MAPEVFRHEKYNETVDIYSFGMILFFLLVGHAPWPTYSGLRAVRLASEQGDRPHIPRYLDVQSVNLLKECWHEDPKARPSFPKILDFLDIYMKDVFRSNMNDVAIAESPVAWKQDGSCRCNIL